MNISYMNERIEISMAIGLIPSKWSQKKVPGGKCIQSDSEVIGGVSALNLCLVPSLVWGRWGAPLDHTPFSWMSEYVHVVG